jgi:ornithine decarboxylase
LACNIFGKKKIKKENKKEEELNEEEELDEEHRKLKQIKTDDESEMVYYINDGLFHSFNCIFTENARPIFNPICLDKKINREIYYSSYIHGLTDKKTDIVASKYPLPELCINDWFFIENFGAYTIVLCTEYQGVKVKERIYYWCEN